MLTRRLLIAARRQPRIRRVGAIAQDKSIVVASTTSTQDSGLFGYLLPIFKAKTGIDVKVVAQGTGQALDTGAPRRCRRGVRACQVGGREIPRRRLRREALSGDVQRLRPDRPEAAIRPASRASKDIVAALKAIKAKGAAFISRGDRSGTHQRRAQALEGGRHRHRQGQGRLVQGDRAGHGRGAQHRVGRRTPMCWPTAAPGSSFKNRGDLVIAVEGDKRLFNQYGVMLVNPEKHPSVKKDLGQQFIDWLVSPEGQKAIADYKINGEQLFYPNANDSGA